MEPFALWKTAVCSAVGVASGREAPGAVQVYPSPLAVGVATISNSRLVNRFKMHSLCYYAALFQTILSIAYVCFYFNHLGHPPLFSLMIYLAAMFFCLGILFGNLNALAMEPLGHIAGIAASVIG